MIGIGKIKSTKRLENYLSKCKIAIDNNITILSAKEIIKQAGDRSNFTLSDDKTELTIESFDGNCVSTAFDKSNMATKYIIIYYCNDEGDSDFIIRDPDWPDFDYDIDLDFLPEEQQILMSLDSKYASVKDFNSTYGAGRNG